MSYVTGTIVKLGNASVNRIATQYSIIEMSSGELLQNKFIANGLDNYLEGAVKNGSVVKIWYDGKRIFGIEIEGGKIYYTRYTGAKKFWFLMLASVPLMVVLIGFGLAAIAAGMLIRLSVMNGKSADLAARGGIAIESQVD